MGNYYIYKFLKEKEREKENNFYIEEGNPVLVLEEK
jgi:hypothetical protein